MNRERPLSTPARPSASHRVAGAGSQTITTAIVILVGAILTFWTGMGVGFRLGVERGKEHWYG